MTTNLDRRSAMQWDVTSDVLAVTEDGHVVLVKAGASPTRNEFKTGYDGVDYAECVFASPLGFAGAYVKASGLVNPRLASAKGLLPAA